MKIYCCGCEDDIKARLTSVVEIYPHRKDLNNIPFWRCDSCGNFVGCHHKTKNKTNPLGCIPTPEIKKARQLIHSILDPLWKSGKISRSGIYSKISERVGKSYHTAQIRSIEEAREIYKIVREYRDIMEGQKHENPHNLRQMPVYYGGEGL